MGGKRIMIDITYDRSEKIYKWVDPDSGEVLTAPSGAANKAKLFQTAVAMLDPELYQAAVRWLEEEPTLERVIWRSVELVANNGVETFADESLLIAKVDSSDEYGRYSLTLDDGFMACECPHWQELGAPYTSSGERVCKHVAAFHLYQRTRENRF